MRRYASLGTRTLEVECAADVHVSVLTGSFSAQPSPLVHKRALGGRPAYVFKSIVKGHMSNRPNVFGR